jgi:hypothetical protein
MQAQAQPSVDVAPPPPPAPPPIPGGVRVFVPGGGGSPQALYAAAKARGRELEEQLESLEERREELSARLRDEALDAVDRKGLQQQLTDLDARITQLNGQIAESDQQIAQVAGIPGAAVEPPPPPRQGPPDEVFVIPIVFTIFVLFPLTIAWARRIWRRSSVAPAAIPPELTDRISRIEHAVESVAVEVERIGEGQRFVTKLFAESGNRPRVEAPR